MQTGSPTNVKTVIDLPDHPKAILALATAIGSLGQEITNIAAADISLKKSENLETVDRQGKHLHSKEWRKYLEELSSTYDLVGELMAQTWIDFFGPDHPLSKLAQKTLDGATPEEFHDEIIKICSEEPEIAIVIGNITADGSGLEDLEDRIKEAARRRMGELDGD
tara:strand:+ start:259 stop:753 length:495 start_codon:yes stop_codon:yes gene_type:complete